MELPTDMSPGEDQERPPLRARTTLGASTGFGAGLFAGLLIGAGEALAIAAGGLGGEAQVLWFGPLLYAAALGALGAVVGAAAGGLCSDEDGILGWASSLALLATFVPASALVLMLRLQRDLHLGDLPPSVLSTLATATAVLALGIVLFGPRVFRGRMGELVRTPTVLVSLLGVSIAGAASAFLLGGSAGSHIPPATPAALADRPNVVLVVVDGLRADALSCYGGPVPTPALCSVGEDGGTRFEGFSHAPWTKPATATILSSLLPSSHGATTRPAVLPRDVELLSEVLRGNGYASGGIVASPHLTSSQGFDQGYDEYHELGPESWFAAKESSRKLLLHRALRSVWLGWKPALDVEDYYPSADAVNDVAFDFLERHRRSRFFLLLHYMDPHEPYFAHPWDGTGVARHQNERPDPVRAETIERLYQGEVAYLDARFAELLARLQQLELEEDTVIAVVADHGQEFAERGGWWHGATLFDEQIRVPFLIRWASGRGLEAADGQLARMLDVAPTLIGQTGTRPPATMQGLDLAEHLEDRDERGRMVFVEADLGDTDLRALRTETWKWIRTAGGGGPPTDALYHLGEDPSETENLANGTSPVAQKLAARAGAQESLARARSVLDGANVLSTREVKALRELGYVQ